MTALARVILRQRSAVILVALILLIAGGITATRMQEELLPNISFNVVSIVTTDPGADPNTVLADVTKPVEVAVAGVPGINTLASTSSQNASIVTIQFNYGTDINQAESKISTALGALSFPSGVQTPKVTAIDFGAFPVLYLAVKNNDSKASLQQTYTLVQKQVAPQLAQLDGVAAADVGGGASPQIAVTLHPALLAKYGLSVAQVDGILQANNIGIPAGNVTDNGVTEPVVTTGKLTTLAQIQNLPITVQLPTGAGGASQGGFSGAQAGGASQGGFGNGQSLAGATGSTGGSTIAPRLVFSKTSPRSRRAQGTSMSWAVHPVRSRASYASTASLLSPSRSARTVMAIS